jgi:small subunit ribosomal protein S25e
VVNVFINEDQASKIIKSSKVITIQDLARQTNVKISTANAFLKKELAQGAVKKVGGFSGHYLYQPVSQ